MILFFTAKYSTYILPIQHCTVLYDFIYYYSTAVYIFGSIYQYSYGKGTIVIIQYIAEISYGRNIFYITKKNYIYIYVCMHRYGINIFIHFLVSFSE